MDPTWLLQHRHATVHSVGWLFTQSADFTSIGIYRCHKAHATYRCANAIGDAFRYRP
jgi:hypothetical protein